ncbi:MAG: hypothetical protein ACRDBO_18440 [Lachnospiraceae bacterium]
MKRNKMKTVLYAGVCVVAMAGMSLTSYATTESTRPASSDQRERPEDDGSVTAKIVSADDDSITVYLTQQHEHNGERPELSEDNAPQALPADTQNIPDKPDSSDGMMPERPEGNEARGGRGMMNFSEETTTLTITGDTVITRGMEQESADISDLTEDSIVRIVTDEDTVVSILIMDMELPEAAE